MPDNLEDRLKEKVQEWFVRSHSQPTEQVQPSSHELPKPKKSAKPRRMGQAKPRLPSHQVAEDSIAAEYDPKHPWWKNPQLYVTGGASLILTGFLGWMLTANRQNDDPDRKISPETPSIYREATLPTPALHGAAVCKGAREQDT